MSILLENGMDTEANMLLALSGIKDDATSTIICVPPSTNWTEDAVINYYARQIVIGAFWRKIKESLQIA